MTPTGDPANQVEHRISREQAQHIAQVDAEEAYGDLSDYRIEITLRTDGWHVNYELTDPDWNGGGPHYIIDPVSGAIVWKRYYQ